MTHLTDKQLAARNQVHNPSLAGTALLRECYVARRTLIESLVRPCVSDQDAYEAWMIKVAYIRRMDHADLRAALAATLVEDNRSSTLVK